MPSFVSAVRRLRLAAIPLCLAFPLASHAAAATAWVATDTRAVSLAAASDLGTADPDTSLPLLVSLKLQNPSILYGYFQHITNPKDPLFGRYLTPAQFAALYAPSATATQQVVDYLRAEGFTGITVSPNRTMIRMTGTVAQAQAAFNTAIHQLQFNGKTVLANITAAQIPAALGNVVLSVTGLNTVPYLHLPHRASTKAGTNGALPPGPPSLDSLSGYSPQQYQKAYDVNPAQDGSDTSIAIIAEGDLTTVLSDLVVYEDTYKLPHVPYTVIKTGYDHSDTSGADEFDLDTQSSTGIAGNVKHLYIYDGGALSDVELLDAYNHWINDGLAVAASASIAGCESLTYAFGELSAYDQLFLQMATQGMTLFNSTGDSGSSCLNPAGNGIPAGVPGVEFPASSPYVVGVGGTTLLVNSDGSYNYELAWSDGGGGTSVFENAPAWQLPVLPTGAAGSMLRAVPDIAMDADANTGANVVVAGKVTVIGGTSLASPLALGSWARIQSANQNTLGFAPPALYAMASGPLTAATGFNDVILGSNVGYTATPGWDYTTGLGTFDIAAISKALKPVASGLKAPAALGGNPCVTPGARIAEGVANSQTDHLPGHNVLAIDIAEPYSTDTASDSFVFTMTVDSLAHVPPATGYFLYYFLPDGSEHYLAYESTPAPGATSNFSYGTIATTETANLLINYVPTQLGYADAGSKLDTAKNQIIWVLKKSNIKGYVEGKSALTRVYGEVDIEATPVAANAGQSTTQPVDDTTEGNYTPVGNAACATGVPVTTSSGGNGSSGGGSGAGTGSAGGSTTAGSGGGVTTATSTGKGRFGGGAMPLVTLLAMAVAIPVRRRRTGKMR